MAALAARLSVGTAATLLCTVPASSTRTDDAKRSFLLIPQVGSGTVALGPAGVTAATGARWNVASGPLSVDVEPGESLYGVVASGTLAIDSLSLGR